MNSSCRILAMCGMLSLGSTLRAGPRTFVCELYAPGHFGNWYEVAGEREMRRMLSEAKEWGFDAYGDWFDTLDCVDPSANDKQYDLANALWDRKKANFRSAQEVGLATDLVITPNHVYRDQLKPEWLAKSGDRVFGQLICPSQPAARQAILDNNERLFADLARAGVRLNAVTFAPYDYGGCNCDACKPWILTFAALCRDLHAIARRYHPDVEMRFIGWWWSAEEHKLFADWMDAHMPGQAVAMALHILYGKTDIADVPLPRGCRRHAFVHIGYGEEPKPFDRYGHTGPMIATERLTRTVQSLQARAAVGVTAYSEGIYDDVNKALLAGLFTGQYASSRDVLRAYARRYFEADATKADTWADWLVPWGRPFSRDASAAREQMRQLSGKPHDWRRRQWELKADLFVAHQAIGKGKEWNRERLAHAEDFWAAYEELQRCVYGIGPSRHILAPPFCGLEWYDSWAQHQRTTATQPTVDEQARLDIPVR